MELKNKECKLLRTEMSDNANLLSDDELGDIFGGYYACGLFCEPSYGDCSPLYCQRHYIHDWQEYN